MNQQRTALDEVFFVRLQTETLGETIKGSDGVTDSEVVEKLEPPAGVEPATY